MKIVDFRREDICYKFKDSSIKMDRMDVWGEPEENSESLLTYCRKYVEPDDDKTAHLVYLYGQGGVGKSFACGELVKKLQNEPYREKIYVVTVDLQRQKCFEDNLKCLADEIIRTTGREGLFQKFSMAYGSYKLRTGEEFEREERTTKWDNLQGNATFDLAVQTAGLFLPIGGLSGAIDLANKGYKWFLDMRGSIQNKGLVHQIESMDAKELRGQLTEYFADDFRALVEDKNKKKIRFVFLLDTVESMRYQVLRSGKDEDYLDWLVGSHGLLRLMPNCFWLLFGREEIPWKNYDREWEVSFLSRELTRPDEEDVRTYLMRQLGQGISAENKEKNTELCAIVDEIIMLTDRYCLAIENSVDVYFRIWNGKLRKNRVTDERKADDYRPCPEEMKEMLLDKRGKKIISSRFLQYYTLQEREVLYTLICLGTWTDEILEKVIWQGAVNNILIYEEICATSFVQSGSNGHRTMHGFMFDVIMEECPQRLKRQLLLSILKHMKKQEIDDSYWLLYESAVHISKFCVCNNGEWTLLGTEFVRAVGYLREHVRFAELFRVCEELYETVKDKNVDDDFLNAVLIGLYFSLVFQKADSEKELGLLREREHFGGFSLEVWKTLQTTAWDVQAFGQAYEVADLLVRKMEGQQANSYYYLILKTRLDLMQELRGRFEPAEIEGEVERLCSVNHELMPHDLRTAEKINARLWADYYSARQDLSGELVSQKIKNCVSQYRSCCTEEELRLDANICVLRLMAIKASQQVDSTDMTETALDGMRILDELYGEKAVEHPDMEFLFLSTWDNLCMTEEDRKLNLKVFEAYYKSFIKGGDWKAYKILSLKCFITVSFAGMMTEETENDRHEMSEIIRQGVFYLSNLKVHSLQDLLRLLLSYQLQGELMLGADVFDSPMDDHNSVISGGQIIRNKLVNNQMLLCLLQKAVESAHGKDMEKQRLDTFMKNIFVKEFMGYSSFAMNHGEEDKRKLLGLLELCGVEVAKILWESEYTGNAEGKEFAILEAFHSWQWRVDSRADACMVNTVLYVMWILRENTSEPTEKDILRLLKENISDSNERVELWLALLQEAAAYGKEWEQHVLDLFREEQNSIFKNQMYRLTEKQINILAGYDPRFEIWDNEGLQALEKEVRAKLAKDGYEAAGIPEDYYSQLADECGEKAYLGYTRTIVYNLKWLTEMLPFRGVWRRESCIKEIMPSNFKKIYKSLEKYLSEDELADVFTAALYNGNFKYRDSEGGRPGKTEISFFDSEYYIWMQEIFGEAFEGRLRAKLQDLYEVREDYERNLKNDYQYQMHKKMSEIRDILLSDFISDDL